MTPSKSQKSLYEDWLKTDEAQNLRQLEGSLGMRLDGIAFFLANNSPTHKNKND